MAAPDGPAPDRLSSLVGVRRVRNGPLMFAAAHDLVLQPGDLVVLQLVEPGGEKNLAIVVIGSGQIIEDAVGIEPTARVARLATEDEISDFDPTGVRLEGAERGRVAGLPKGWEAWVP